MNRDLLQRLDRWTEAGLITPEQRAAIVAAEAEQSEPGWQFTTIAQYFGGFMILFAYSVFWTLRWSDLPASTQTMVALISLLVIGALGAWLRRRERLGGNLLVFAATGILPLVVFSAMRTFGLWPEGPSFDTLPYDAYWRREAVAQVTLASITVAGTLVALAWARFPLMTLLVTGWGLVLIGSATRLLVGPNASEAQQLTIAGYGAALLALGWWVARALTEHEGDRFGFWLDLSGLIALLGGLGAYALSDDRVLPGLLFLVISVGLVWIGARLARTTFLVFGALGVYAYLGKLAFDTFRETLGFPIALALMGLLLVGGAIAFQRLAPGKGARGVEKV